MKKVKGIELQKMSYAIDYGKWLLKAAEKGDLQHLLSLLEKVDVNVGDELGFRALHYAAQAGNTECVRALISGGADVLACGHGGWTALHYAAFHGKTDCVRVMLSSIDTEKRIRLLNMQTEDGKTALYLATKAGHQDVVEFLQ